MEQISKNVVNKLKEMKETLAIAESLTGGMVAGKIVDVSGASSVFKGGVVAYMLEIKEKVLSIPLTHTIKTDGVDLETAKMMAKNVSELMDSDYGLSTTGIAEHWDSRHEQAFIAFYDRKKDLFLHQHIVFDEKNIKREDVREIVSLKSLELCFKGIS